jgi:hypothetical protein
MKTAGIQVVFPEHAKHSETYNGILGCPYVKQLHAVS